VGYIFRVGVRVTVYVSHTRFGFHAATVGHGGVTRGALGRARLCQAVDGPKCSAANILADAVSGLEDASI